jgi:hypothetical protein
LGSRGAARSPVLAKSCAFLVVDWSPQDVARAIFAQQNARCGKRRIHAGANLVRKEFMEYLVVLVTAAMIALYAVIINHHFPKT